MSNVELFEVKVGYLRSVAEQSLAQISGQQGWQGGCRFATIPELTFPDSSMAEQFAVNEKVLGSSPSRGATCCLSGPNFCPRKVEYGDSR